MIHAHRPQPAHRGGLQQPGAEPAQRSRLYVAARSLAANIAESITIPQRSASAAAAAGRGLCAARRDRRRPLFVFDGGDGARRHGRRHACELIKGQGDPEWLLIPSGATSLSVFRPRTPIVTASFYSN
jgi:hypothetical protein